MNVSVERVLPWGTMNLSTTDGEVFYGAVKSYDLVFVEFRTFVSETGIEDRLIYIPIMRIASLTSA